MCVLAIAWAAHPRWRLVVAANRDEYHDRPSAPLARWSVEEAGGGLIAGRDLRAGGTWLAVAEAGRFAAVTNIRDLAGPDPACLSRGALVTGLATGEAPAPVDLARYNPFNAVSISPAAALFLSNRPAASVRPLAPGLHAMSNGPLDPPWRKTVRLKALLAERLDVDDPNEALFAILRDRGGPRGSYDDPSDIFIDDPVYGTRCSTILTVDAEGGGRIVERRFDARGHVAGETTIDFRWP